jgi:hypothetical protein
MLFFYFFYTKFSFTRTDISCYNPDRHLIHLLILIIPKIFNKKIRSFLFTIHRFKCRV